MACHWPVANSVVLIWPPMLKIFKCIQFVFPVERDKNFLLDVKKIFEMMRQTCFFFTKSIKNSSEFDGGCYQLSTIKRF